MSKEVHSSVSIVLTYVGGALLAYAAIRLFVIPVRYEYEMADIRTWGCGGFGGVLKALTADGDINNLCSEEAWNRINSSLIWVCLGPGMLLAGLMIRRDGIEKAES